MVRLRPHLATPPSTLRPFFSPFDDAMDSVHLDVHRLQQTSLEVSPMAVWNVVQTLRGREVYGNITACQTDCLTYRTPYRVLRYDVERLLDLVQQLAQNLLNGKDWLLYHQIPFS